METKAVRDGDDYVVNGQKIWTSNGHVADRMILLARTNPDVPKHKGISAFVVDMKTPGITVQPIPNMAYRHDFNQVFFEDVRVPAKDLMGGEDNGWYVATTTLDFERSNIAAISGARRTVHDLIALGEGAMHPGGRPWDTPTVRNTLAELAVEVEVGRLLAYRTAWLQARGEVPNYEASIGKLWMAMLGIKVGKHRRQPDGRVRPAPPGSPWAQLHGRVLTAYLLAVVRAHRRRHQRGPAQHHRPARARAAARVTARAAPVSFALIRPRPWLRPRGLSGPPGWLRGLPQAVRPGPAAHRPAVPLPRPSSATALNGPAAPPPARWQ